MMMQLNVPSLPELYFVIMMKVKHKTFLLYFDF